MIRNIKLVLAYDGSAYHGWQSQPGILTIQDVLEKAVLKLTGSFSRIVASGRTDAGVHAKGQVANFRTSVLIPIVAFKNGLNSLLPRDIVVLDACEVEYGFHAIGSCLSKEYEYKILNASTRDPLWNGRAWFCRGNFDIASMRIAAAFFKGCHDFTSVRASGCSAKHSERNVTVCDIRQEIFFDSSLNQGKLFTLRIAANGFLRYMVRNITGLVVETGLGHRLPEDIPEILKARNRSRAGVTAPACGLYLKRVVY